MAERQRTRPKVQRLTRGGNCTHLVVLLVEAARDVALRLGLDKEGDKETGGDEDEEGSGDDTEDVHALSDLGELLRRSGDEKRGGGKRARGRSQAPGAGRLPAQVLAARASED